MRPFRANSQTPAALHPLPAMATPRSLRGFLDAATHDILDTPFASLVLVPRIDHESLLAELTHLRQQLEDYADHYDEKPEAMPPPRRVDRNASDGSTARIIELELKVASLEADKTRLEQMAQVRRSVEESESALLKKQLQETEAKHGETEAKSRAMKSEIAKLRTMLQQYQTEVPKPGNDNRLKELEEQNSKLSVACKNLEGEKQAWINKRAVLEQRVTTCLQSSNEHKQNADEARNEVDALRKQVDEGRRIANEARRNSGRNGQLDVELKKTQEELQNMTSLKDKIQHRCSEVQDRLLNESKRTHDLHEQAKEREAENKRLIAKNDDLATQKDTLETENDKLHKAKLAVEKENEKLMESRSDLEKAAEQLSKVSDLDDAELSKRAVKVSNREADLSKLEGKIAVRETEVSNREGAVSKREDTVSKREDTVSKREAAAAKRELVVPQAPPTPGFTTPITPSTDVADTIRERLDLENKIKLLTADLTRTAAQLDKRTLEFNAITADLTQAKRSLHLFGERENKILGDFDQVRKENLKLRQIVEEYERSLATLQREKDESEANLAALKREVDRLGLKGAIPSEELDPGTPDGDPTADASSGFSFRGAAKRKSERPQSIPVIALDSPPLKRPKLSPPNANLPQRPPRPVYLLTSTEKVIYQKLRNALQSHFPEVSVAEARRHLDDSLNQWVIRFSEHPMNPGKEVYVGNNCSARLHMPSARDGRCAVCEGAHDVFECPNVEKKPGPNGHGHRKRERERMADTYVPEREWGGGGGGERDRWSGHYQGRGGLFDRIQMPVGNGDSWVPDGRRD